MDPIYTSIVSSTMKHCIYLLDIYINDIYFISFEDDYSLYYELLNTLIQTSIC